MSAIEDEIRRIVREEIAKLLPQKKSLRELRKAAGMTQKRLSEASGVAEMTINGIETGKAQPRKRTIEILAKTLGVRPADIAS